MPIPADRSAILSEISTVEEKLSKLKAETGRAEEQLSTLKDTLENLEESHPAGTNTTTRASSTRHQTPDEKVGNGAHVWFFFEAPIQASLARKMGCYLITVTMSHHHQLSMSSYDRLFPNQDIMASGGFGNLIALPL